MKGYRCPWTATISPAGFWHASSHLTCPVPHPPEALLLISESDQQCRAKAKILLWELWYFGHWLCAMFVSKHLWLRWNSSLLKTRPPSSGLCLQSQVLWQLLLRACSSSSNNVKSPSSRDPAELLSAAYVFTSTALGRGPSAVSVAGLRAYNSGQAHAGCLLSTSLSEWMVEYMVLCLVFLAVSPTTPSSW